MRKKRRMKINESEKLTKKRKRKMMMRRKGRNRMEKRNETCCHKYAQGGHETQEKERETEKEKDDVDERNNKMATKTSKK